MKRKKVAVKVRHNCMNGEKIIIEREMRRSKTLFIAKLWEPWLLENENAYKIGYELNNLTRKIRELLIELEAEEAKLRAMKAEITSAKDSSMGYSASYTMMVDKKKLSRNYKSGLIKPVNDWKALIDKSFLNPAT